MKAICTIPEMLGMLSNEGRLLAEFAMKGGIDLFKEHGNVNPAIMWMAADGKVHLVDVPEMSDRSRPVVWGGMAMIRKNFRVSAFTSEVWMVEGSKENPADIRVMPRNNPNRIEALILTLWEGKRTLMFQALIHRQPNRLDPWKAIYDSHFPNKQVDGLMGGMMEGGLNEADGN